MIALKILGILIVILLLIGLLRVGVRLSFGEKTDIMLVIGPLRRPIPKRKKKKPPENAEEPTQKTKKKHSFPKPTFEEILDLVSTALSALRATLRRTCRHLHIDPLELTVMFGGNDPANIAASYGYANAAMWTIMPLAEDTFCIPDPSIHLRMDYDAPKTRADGTIGVSLRVLAMIAIALTLAFPLFRWYLRLKRAHRNDIVSTKTSDAASEQAENKTA